VEVDVRPARDADEPDLIHLARLAYARYVPRIGQDPAPMSADYAAAIADDAAWVAEIEQHIVGLLVVRPRPDHLLLENVAVTPGMQGAGIGARLLGVAESLARQHGVLELRLYTNIAMTENLAYYPRHGYRETHRATQDGYERVFFSKTIAPESTANLL
jgi:GNAT superfamily N-acetyltransferase